jgi:hypothetical protein
MDGAIARKKAGKSVAIDIAHFDLPTEAVSSAEGLSEDACKRKLWTLADAIARDEGFEHGLGLQHRAGEIMGVSDTQASKAYGRFGLADAASA